MSPPSARARRLLLLLREQLGIQGLGPDPGPVDAGVPLPPLLLLPTLEVTEAEAGGEA